MSWLNRLFPWLQPSEDDPEDDDDPYRGLHIKVKVPDLENLIEHHGIGIGNEEVIHFSNQNESRLSKCKLTKISKCEITKTSIKKFCENRVNPEIVHYEEEPYELARVVLNAKTLYAISLYKNKYFSHSEAKETIEREFGKRQASEIEEYRSKIEDKYDLNYHFFKNNCEHFATFCKTGKPTSKQVDKFNQIMLGLGLFFGIGGLGINFVKIALKPSNDY
jgi:hypothetical protein